MDMLVIALAAVISLIAGYYLGYRTSEDRALESISRQGAGRASDRAAFLHTVRRELANLLIWENPQKFLQLYERLHAEISQYDKLKAPHLQHEYDELAKRYPQFQDFDVLGVRTYVLYSDARSHLSDGELEAVYCDITRFVAILAATDPNWHSFASTSDQELKHLMEYAKRLLDTKLKMRLQRAAQDAQLIDDVRRRLDRMVQGAVVTEEVDLIFRVPLDDQVRTVRRIFHVAEDRLGIHFKNTNEYGLFGTFVSDEGRAYQSYYRSDPSFQLEQWLDSSPAIFEYFGAVRD